MQSVKKDGKPKFATPQREKRSPSTAVFQVFSSLFPGALTARLSDISKTGARVHLKNAPYKNELISFSAIDGSGKTITSGNAKVIWTKEDRGKGGTFGVEFLEPLSRQESEKIMATDSWLDWDQFVGP